MESISYKIFFSYEVDQIILSRTPMAGCLRHEEALAQEQHIFYEKEFLNSQGCLPKPVYD